MAVNYYRWDDTSAPTLNGVAGSLIALLDACLVDGYGAKAAAGWSHAFTAGTNKAVYRNGTDAYYRVDDNGTNGSQFGEFRGYRAMTDNDTGTDSFPDSTIRTISCVLKADTTAATAREWYLVENNGMVFMSWNPRAVPLSTSESAFYMFGKFDSFMTGDVANHLCMTAHARATGGSYGVPLLGDLSTNIGAAETLGYYPWIAQDFSATGTSVSSTCVPKLSIKGSTSWYPSTEGLLYPSAKQGSLIVSDGVLLVHRPYDDIADAKEADIRGEIRGLSLSGNDLTTGWTGSCGDEFSNESGTIDYVIMAGSTTGTNYYMFIQLTDPWV